MYLIVAVTEKGMGPVPTPRQMLNTEVNASDLCHIVLKRKFWQHWWVQGERVSGVENSVGGTDLHRWLPCAGTVHLEPAD